MAFRSSNWANILFITIHGLNTKLLNRTYSFCNGSYCRCETVDAVLTRTLSSNEHILLVLKASNPETLWLAFAILAVSNKMCHIIQRINLQALYYWLLYPQCAKSALFSSHYLSWLALYWRLDNNTVLILELVAHHFIESNCLLFFDDINNTKISWRKVGR